MRDIALILTGGEPGLARVGLLPEDDLPSVRAESLVYSLHTRLERSVFACRKRFRSAVADEQLPTVVVKVDPSGKRRRRQVAGIQIVLLQDLGGLDRYREMSGDVA